MNLSLIDAFGKFGAKPSNRLRGLSAMAADGALVLNCQRAYFAHPSRGVLRYEDSLSRESAESKDAQLLGQHLTLARDGALPVRMVVTSVEEKTGKSSRRCHVRTDLIGKVVTFDGDRFVIDFTRAQAMRQRAPLTPGDRK
ncbi:MAG TPA: hypothetical protein VHB68_05005 [Steroidobacteraceae bacterium]|nr:hypothetical protein [Steroidobacteraceae bacterium]